MIDEAFDRAYQACRATLNRALLRAVPALKRAAGTPPQDGPRS